MTEVASAFLIGAAILYASGKPSAKIWFATGFGLGVVSLAVYASQTFMK